MAAEEHPRASDLQHRDIGAAWFCHLLGREPDARPVDGLAEWHRGQEAGLQLFEDTANAGRATNALIVER